MWLLHLFVPVLLIQGLWVRLRTPRLPGASGPRSGTVERGGRTFELIVLGESPVEGVGARTHEFALTGQTASALARRTDRTVKWQASGVSGATARTALRDLVPQIAGRNADAVIIALGVSDVLSWRSVYSWTRDVERLISGVRRHVHDSLIV